MRVIDSVWKIPFTGPKNTKIKHKNKLPYILGANGFNFWRVCSSFVCPICCCCCFSSSPLNWFIKQSKNSDSKRGRRTNRFRFTKYRIAIRPAAFPLSLSPLSVTRGKSPRVKFFPRGFLMRYASTDKVKERLLVVEIAIKTQLAHKDQIS